MRELLRQAQTGRGSAAVAIALVVAGFAGSLILGERADDDEPSGIGSAQGESPSPSEERTPQPNDCEETPFRPTFVPLGIGGRSQAGSSAEPGGEPPNIREHWPGPAPGIGVDLIGSDYVFSESPRNEKTIGVLGGSGRLATDGAVHVVEFSAEDCEWAVAGYGVARKDLRRMAKGLILSSRRERSDCRAKNVPFRPETVPPRWNSEPEPGHGRVLGVFQAAPAGSTVRVYISEDAVIDITVPDPVRVLGDTGRIGGWDEGTAVIFDFDGCHFTLLGSVEVRPEELRAFAESLRPTPDS